MQVQYEGYYWSATSEMVSYPEGSYTSIEYYYANFYSTGVRVSDQWVYTGLAVRLVTNVE